MRVGVNDGRGGVGGVGSGIRKDIRGENPAIFTDSTSGIIVH